MSPRYGSFAIQAFHLMNEFDYANMHCLRLSFIEYEEKEQNGLCFPFSPFCLFFSLLRLWFFCLFCLLCFIKTYEIQILGKFRLTRNVEPFYYRKKKIIIRDEVVYLRFRKIVAHKFKSVFKLTCLAKNFPSNSWKSPASPFFSMPVPSNTMTDGIMVAFLVKRMRWIWKRCVGDGNTASWISISLWK